MIGIIMVFFVLAKRILRSIYEGWEARYNADMDLEVVGLGGEA